MIEHVANPLEFCQSLSSLTVPNGATVVSTINRSMRAYAAAIVAAEYILRWVGTILHILIKLDSPFPLCWRNMLPQLNLDCKTTFVVCQPVTDILNFFGTPAAS